ncbi:hypothetical protein BSKO_07887 [Bryopsis sp. KO-2023]|nr:hypothetical protein BSKO_07887 [Bryopsis sp. KO-2023]
MAVLMRVLLGVLACLACLAAVNAQVQVASPWIAGRATSYGSEPWLWSIHEGSCGYGYIWPDEPLGWDKAAMPDVHPDYAGSCGRCYEVACDPTLFSDNFNNAIDRRHVCYDSSQSVVVHVSDTCPCNYPANFYMNKRWCCGDMDHLDLSIWAFEKLANAKWGVIGIKYRQVPCTQTPANPAPAPANPFPGVPPPPGAVRPTKPRFAGPSPVDGTNEEADIPSIGGVERIFEGKAQKGWVETSWESKKVRTRKTDPKTAACYKLESGGAFAVETTKPNFLGQVSLEFWVRTSDGVPDININIAGPRGACRMVKLQDMNKSAVNHDDYTKFDVYLGLFDRQDEHTVVAFAAEFKGCGGNAAEDLTQLMFTNDLPEETQTICLDNVRLVG